MLSSLMELPDLNQFSDLDPMTEEELPGPQEEGLCNITASIHCNDCSDSSPKETYDHLFG